MLIFVFQVPLAIAVSSDVIAAILMKFIRGYKHWQQQTLNLQVVKWLSLGSVLGSLTGVAILHLIKRSGALNLDGILLRVIGVMILLVTLLGLLQLIVVAKLKLAEPPKFDLNTKLVVS